MARSEASPMGGIVTSPVYDTVTSSDTYTSPGIALIIVNQKFQVPGYNERRGAHEDCRLLRNAFETMGFTVREVFNKTAIEILREVKKVSEMDHSTFTNFVLAASSHGDRQADDLKLRMYDTIVGVDGRFLSFDRLTSHFTESRCPSLKGKPKLFFIQACRGEGLSEEATASECTTHMRPLQGDPPGGDDEADATRRPPPPRPEIVDSDDIPLMRDYLLACAVPPDFFAFHNAKGSWFIRVLCDVLLEQRGRSDLLSMLTEVNSRVAREFKTNAPNNPDYDGRQTMPWVASMLRKQVHL